MKRIEFLHGDGSSSAVMQPLAKAMGRVFTARRDRDDPRANPPEEQNRAEAHHLTIIDP